MFSACKDSQETDAEREDRQLLLSLAWQCAAGKVTEKELRRQMSELFVRLRAVSATDFSETWDGSSRSFHLLAEVC